MLGSWRRRRTKAIDERVYRAICAVQDSPLVFPSTVASLTGLSYSAAEQSLGRLAIKGVLWAVPRSFGVAFKRRATAERDPAGAGEEQG